MRSGWAQAVSLFRRRGFRLSSGAGDTAELSRCRPAQSRVASPDTLKQSIPVAHLGGVVQRALCHDVERCLYLASITQRHHRTERHPGALTIGCPAAHMLDWLIQPFPTGATSRIQAAVGEIERAHEADVQPKELRQGSCSVLSTGCPR